MTQEKTQVRTIVAEGLWSGLKDRLALLLALLAVVAFTFAAYHAVPYFHFVTWDDNIHVYDNPYFSHFDLHDIAHFWIKPYKNLYVPLSYTLFGLLVVAAYRTPRHILIVGGPTPLDPHVFHAASLVLHLINVVLVFFLLRRLFRQDLPAALGSLLFAVHPLQVESVAWISELRGLLAALFTLVSLHLYLKCSDRRDAEDGAAAAVFYVAAIVAIVCAMLSKPSSLTACLIVFAFGRCACALPWRTAVTDALPFAMVGLILFFITAQVQGVPRDQVTALWQRPFIAGDAVAFYLAKLVAPVSLTIDYGRRPFWVLAHWWAYADWVAPAIVTVVCVILWKRAPYLLFGWAVFVSVLVPVLGFAPFVYQYFSTTADRYAYLALLGVSISVAGAIGALHGRRRVIAVGLMGVWLAGLWLVCNRQCTCWHDSMSLYEHALSVNPESSIVNENLGLILDQQKRYDEGVPYLRRAVEMSPDSATFTTNLGLLDSDMGDWSDAEALFRRTIAMNPDYAIAYRGLGLLLMRKGRTSEAVTDLSTALHLSPDDYLSSVNLAAYFAQKGNYDAAIEWARSGVRQTPNYEPLWRYLGLSLCAENRWTEAETSLSRANQLDPTDTQVNYGLALVKQQLKESL